MPALRTRAIASPSASRIDAMRKLPLSFTDRKSTRLNSSHLEISYAVFCLTKKSVVVRPIVQPERTEVGLVRIVVRLPPVVIRAFEIVRAARPLHNTYKHNRKRDGDDDLAP